MDMQNVESSNVESVGYDPDTQEMHVRYRNGQLYKYEGVPEEVHQTVIGSDSIGTELHRSVKGTYPHTRLE